MNELLRNARPFDIVKQDIDDLFEEAKNWLDGGTVQSEAEAEAVAKLLDMARDAKKRADAERKAENKPFDEGKKEVQARFNPILKQADAIADACKASLQPWRDRITREKAEQARIAREEAEAAERAAQEAMAKTSVADVAARAEAEKLAEAAKSAEKTAKRLNKDATTGTGLRTVWVGEIADITEALRHYWKSEKHTFHFAEFVQRLLDEDVRAGARDVPGCTIKQEKRAV